MQFFRVVTEQLSVGNSYIHNPIAFPLKILLCSCQGKQQDWRARSPVNPDRKWKVT